jgi:hypothetical protein
VDQAARKQATPADVNERKRPVNRKARDVDAFAQQECVDYQQQRDRDSDPRDHGNERARADETHDRAIEPQPRENRHAREQRCEIQPAVFADIVDRRARLEADGGPQRGGDAYDVRQQHQHPLVAPREPE